MPSYSSIPASSDRSAKRAYEPRRMHRRALAEEDRRGERRGEMRDAIARDGLFRMTQRARSLDRELD